jgi:alkaline phosphatase D
VDTTFPYGVASGDPWPHSVLLWTCVTAARSKETEVAWVVGRDERLRDVADRGASIARPATDGTISVEATGLAPSSTYYYRFSADGRDSAVGRTRTGPADDCELTKIAFCSCAKYTAGFFNAYARIAEHEDLDFVVHLGDYIYVAGNDDPKARGPSIGRGVEPPHECVTLADYRARYAHYRRDPDVQRLHLRHPVVAMPDDNDIANDAWRDGAGSHDPERHGDWHQRKAAALQAWQEWIPARIDGPNKLYRRLPLGKLGDLLLLDERTERDRQTGRPEMEDPRRSMLGKAQYAWLLESLAAVPGTWRLIGNPVMIGQAFTELEARDVGEPLSEVGVLSKTDDGPDPDQWDGYPAERDRLFRAIRERELANVVFVSGDVHTSWAVDLRRDEEPPSTPALAVELVAPSVTSENLDEVLGVPPGTRSKRIEERVLADNNHVRWVNLDDHGYVLLTIRPDYLEAEWHFVDDHTRRTDSQHIGAAFRVAAGSPRLEHVAF